MSSCASYQTAMQAPYGEHTARPLSSMHLKSICDKISDSFARIWLTDISPPSWPLNSTQCSVNEDFHLFLSLGCAYAAGLDVQNRSNSLLCYLNEDHSIDREALRARGGIAYISDAFSQWAGEEARPRSTKQPLKRSFEGVRTLQPRSMIIYRTRYYSEETADPLENVVFARDDSWSELSWLPAGPAYDDIGDGLRSNGRTGPQMARYCEWYAVSCPTNPFPKEAPTNLKPVLDERKYFYIDQESSVLYNFSMRSLAKSVVNGTLLTVYACGTLANDRRLLSMVFEEAVNAVYPRAASYFKHLLTNDQPALLRLLEEYRAADAADIGSTGAGQYDANWASMVRCEAYRAHPGSYVPGHCQENKDEKTQSALRRGQSYPTPRFPVSHLSGNSHENKDKKSQPASRQEQAPPAPLGHVQKAQTEISVRAPRQGIPTEGSFRVVGSSSSHRDFSPY